MKLSVLSTIDPLVRDVTSMSLSDTCAVLTVSLDDEATTLGLVLPSGQEMHRRVPLTHPCITCSLRHAVIPLLEEWHERLDDVLLALPPAVESINVVPGLSEMLEQHPFLSDSQIASVVHASDLGPALEDLLHHVSLQDRGLALFEDDDRCSGEVLAVDLGYADVIVTLGEEPLAAELVEHLRPHDSALVTTLASLTGDFIFQGHHDVAAAIERVHPVTTAAWGGPTRYGVWTLDLHSDRPFHPERLTEALSALSPDGVCVRGCFWLPTRPRTICTWNSNGTSISVGTAGEWERSPMTHLIVTGIGDLQDSIENAFAGALLDRSDMAYLPQWAHSSDGLDDWFPED